MHFHGCLRYSEGVHLFLFFPALGLCFWIWEISEIVGFFNQSWRIISHHYFFPFALFPFPRMFTRPTLYRVILSSMTPNFSFRLVIPLSFYASFWVISSDLHSSSLIFALSLPCYLTCPLNFIIHCILYFHTVFIIFRIFILLQIVLCLEYV
jgi:hypothetical protein